MTGRLPSTASVAESDGGTRLCAPSAARNAGTIVTFLADHAPASGEALELASGTGQHVAALGAALPGLHWQPTDIDPARLRSIDAHVADAGLHNVRKARALNAARPGWHTEFSGRDLILLVNLLHLIPADAARVILSEAALALRPGGVLMLYGPFAREGALTSDGDRRFDAQLRAADPAIGYKDTRDMNVWLEAAGLTVAEPAEMPANNLFWRATRQEGTA